MATKQNGVLATFTPTVTPYTHSTQTATSLAITTQGWPMYTCPGATMVSGKLIIANNFNYYIILYFMKNYISSRILLQLKIIFFLHQYNFIKK